MSFVLGLTGSIGMGKSTTAAMFRAAGVLVHDADVVVHGLYEGEDGGETAALVEAAFPGTCSNGRVDRSRLASHVLGKPEALKRLETIIHPRVRQSEMAFRRNAAENRVPLVVLDVPLLFETGGDKRCDAVLVVTASGDTQKQRVLSRPGMDEDKLRAILARQVPDGEKRARAHFIVDTGQGLPCARLEVQAILRCLAGRFGAPLKPEMALKP